MLRPIEKALTGSHSAEQFALEQALALHDAYHEKVSACDARIEAVLNRSWTPISPFQEQIR